MFPGASQKGWADRRLKPARPARGACQRFSMNSRAMNGLLTRPTSSRSLATVAGGLALTLCCLGACFVVSPRTGARLYGLPERQADVAYVRALGFRDLGLAAALMSAGASARAIRAVAVGGAVIPMLDILLVAQARGRGATGAVALHALSAVALVALSVCAGWRASPR